MERSKKIKIAITAVLLGLTLLFIWGNSCLSKTASGEESGAVFTLVQPIFDFIFGKGVITHSAFRKMAHFSEFALLGLEINYLYFLICGIEKKRLSEIISVGLFVAVIDESLQILSKRGPAVIDVLIDYSGYLFATAVFFFIVLLQKSIKNK